LLFPKEKPLLRIPPDEKTFRRFKREANEEEGSEEEGERREEERERGTGKRWRERKEKKAKACDYTTYL